MAAQCYWCVTNRDAVLGDPLGTCSDCWVFSCGDHAERDAAIGKWRCFDGVAKLVAAGAHFEDAESANGEPISTSAGLHERFPRIAADTFETRAHWREQSGRLAETAVRVARELPGPEIADGDLDPELLADAVGIVAHYLPPRGEPSVRLELVAEPPGAPLGGRLGRLLQEL